VCQEFELETGNNAIPRTASGFGGGIGNTGAVVGAVMAISLKMERGETMEDWLRIAAAAQEFRRRFEAEMGTINCRELTGADLTTEQGLKQLMNSDTSQKVCTPAAGTAYWLVMDLLQETT